MSWPQPPGGASPQAPFSGRPQQSFPGAYVPPTVAPSVATLWTEHTSPDGRKYYYHTVTKQSSWDKPEELKTAEERALGNCPWKEFTSDVGRKYYYNSETQESKWEMPQEYKEYMERLEKEKKQNSAQHDLSMNGASVIPTQHDLERARNLSMPGPTGVNATPVNTAARHVPFIVQAQAEIKIEFDTKEEAEAAFKQLLKESGVRPDWTWEQTMRAVITKPMYKALKTLPERRQAYQNYVDDLRRQEEEERRAKAAKIRTDFIKLLESHPEITSSSRYRRVCDLLANEPAFQAAEDDRTREDIFNEYVYDLRKQEKEAQRLKRKENMEKFQHLLKSLPNITMTTRWKDAQAIYTATPEYQEDESLQKMDMLDFLAVFEEHIKALEQEHAAKKKRAWDAKKRRERKNRDEFRALMDDLRQKGSITARSRWTEIYPTISSDERYLSMLGQPGSTPLDLFWDIVEELDETLLHHEKIVTDLIKAGTVSVTPHVSFDQFKASVTSYERAVGVPDTNLKIIYDQLVKKYERKSRKKMNAFKSIIKHFELMFKPDVTWEQVRPFLETTDEFKAIDHEEQRIEVFNKFKERLKEKHSKKSAGSDDEDGYVRDEDYEDDRPSSGDRKRKHKSHRSHHRKSHHYSDYSGNESSDRDDKRRRRKRSKYDDHSSRYDDTRYSDTRSGDVRHGDSRHHDTRHFDGRHPDYRDVDDYRKQSSPKVPVKQEVQPKEEAPVKQVKEEFISTVVRHGDSSAEEGEYVE